MPNKYGNPKAKRLVEKLLGEASLPQKPAYNLGIGDVKVKGVSSKGDVGSNIEDLAYKLAKMCGVEFANDPELKSWILSLDDEEWDDIQQNDDEQEFGSDEIGAVKEWASDDSGPKLSSHEKAVQPKGYAAWNAKVDRIAAERGIDPASLDGMRREMYRDGMTPEDIFDVE